MIMRVPQKPLFFLFPKFPILLIFLIFLLICGGFHSVFAQNLIEISADRQLNYANHCFEKMDYTAAAAEYKKFIYFFPDDERIDNKLNFTFNKAQARTIRAALSNTFGFGGHNFSVIFSKLNE